MSLEIINAGPLSSIQDLGRKGFQSIGVSPGGPMDVFSFLWGNRLLDNDDNAAQIEIAMGHFQAEFKEETLIALTGADVDAKLDDQRIKAWQTHRAKKGSLLKLNGCKSGFYSYLSIKDGFHISKVLNSSATVLSNAMGGLNGNGEKLKKKDCIPYHAFSKKIPIRQVPELFIPNYSKKLILEVIPCYQYQQFSKVQRKTFFNSFYQLTPQMNRMGYRLLGASIKFPHQQLLSEGIVLGSIQIPADGQPIILMSDHQTIGGYPKMGCLSLKSICQLAQASPNTHIQFTLKNRDEAELEKKNILMSFRHLPL